MSLIGLASTLTQESSIRNIQSQASLTHKQRSDETVISVTDGLRPMVFAQMLQGLRAGSAQEAGVVPPVIFIVTATGRETEDLMAELPSWVPDAQIVDFPAWETLPHERLSPRSDTVGRRLEVMRRLKYPGQNPLDIVVAPVRSLLQPVVEGLADLAPVTLTQGDQYQFDDVVSDLVAAAYSRTDMVVKRGEFAVRGGIIDVFPPTADHPVRVEFFGDEIEQLRWFAVADQRTVRSGEHPQQIVAPPCREILITPDVQSRAARLRSQLPGAEALLEKIAGGIYAEGMESLAPLLAQRMIPVSALLPSESLIVVMEPEKVRARAADLVATNEEFLAAAWESAADTDVAPLSVAGAEIEGRTLESGSFYTLEQARSAAIGAGLGWWATTALPVDSSLGDVDATTSDAVIALLDSQADTLTVRGREPRSFNAQVQVMLDDLQSSVKDGWTIVAVTEGPGPLQRLQEVFQDVDIPVTRHESLDDAPHAGMINLTCATATRGFVLDTLKLAFVTEKDLLGRASVHVAKNSRQLPQRRRRHAVDPLALNKGDYVVHEQHGIGQFVELIARPIAGSVPAVGNKRPMREYLVVEYAASKRNGARDRLFVPTDQLDQISHYVGGETPTLSKMGGADWNQKKKAAKRAVKDIAAELIRLYSARMATRGHAFGQDTAWQRELEEAFPYIETPDQLTTIDEVKADMEREIPMDRLISGDVGYGKTEVAVRAAFKAVQDGKQVAVLVPTTLLGQQHAETFSERYSGFPVRVAALSRFQTPKESREVLQGLADGSVDVVIGTHRLLGSEVKFKDLGLVIIDEEQRFGVEHKEKLKAMRTNVDVLAMSATPIPRTLEMSLTGIRETSTLATAPEERHPVLTYVGAYTHKQITAAIRRELMREGQVFFVHNRVSSIQRRAAELRELVPEARVAVAHGQMGENELEQIIVDFYEKRFDVLVSTTIVETGLDIANANTLIVDGADKYGLSQLHQLRGRVGRGRERAYAYFLYDAEKVLNETALERLKAVAAHSELGAGLQLAQKDLEIRGAGNLLGGEQSGHIAGVGFDMYLRLVGEAVAQYRGEQDQAPVEMKIELPVNAHLPHEYVPGERLRLDAYRRLAAAADLAAVAEVAEELEDRYGKLPDPARLLLDVARLRIKARAVGLVDVAVQGNNIRFGPVDLPESRRMRLERMYPGSKYVPVPQAEDHMLLIPKPKTARVGGKDLVDAQILGWAQEVMENIIESPTSSAVSAAQNGDK